MLIKMLLPVVLMVLVYPLIEGHCCCENETSCCSKSSGIISESSQPAVCRPGKAGPRGEKGTRGKTGQKGDAGERLTLDQVHVDKIADLETSLRVLQKSNENLKAAVECLLNPTSYTYKISTSMMDWFAARKYCQSLGGDLAVHGMKNFTERLSIVSGLPENRFWIGANDFSREGMWTWVDGKLLIDSESHWNEGNPDDWSDDEDCGELRSFDWRTNDRGCDRTDGQALCEIPVHC